MAVIILASRPPTSFMHSAGIIGQCTSAQLTDEITSFVSLLTATPVKAPATIAENVVAIMTLRIVLISLPSWLPALFPAGCGSPPLNHHA